MDSYLHAANTRVSQAFRPSTQKNHRYIMKLFIGFALALRQDYSRPSVALVMAFIEHLTVTQRTAAAVLSSISTLKAVLQRHQIPIISFAAKSVELQLRSVKINKRTPAVQRPPVRLRNLRLIISHLHHMDYASHLTVAILILFTTAFRQSNLAAATVRGFDQSATLLGRMLGSPWPMCKSSKSGLKLANKSHEIGGWLCLAWRAHHSAYMPL